MNLIYIGLIVVAALIGLAVLDGADRISEAILTSARIADLTTVQLPQYDGYLLTSECIYRPDGTVCHAFEDSLEAQGVMLQFEEWGE